MRKRLTKQADPYTLGRDKENPPVEKYKNGDPSSWAEDPDMKHRWEGEKREETGHAAPSGEKESAEWPKAAKESALKSAKELKAKAINCVRIAGFMFPNASEAELENIGFSLMELSPRAIQAHLDMIEKSEKSATATDDVGADLRELVARTKKLVAEAEADDAEGEDEAMEEDDQEMTEQEKSASVLAKKAKVLIAEAELSAEEGKEEAAEEKKKEAKKLLAQAKKVLAGELPPALKENAEKMKEKHEAKEEDMAAPAAAAPAEAAPAPAAPVLASIEAKKAEALRHLEAAKKLMAEVEEHKVPGTMDQEHPAAAEADDEMKEEAKEEDEKDALPAEEAKEEDEKEEEEAAEGDDMEMGDIDMVPSESDEELDDLFMSPDMKEAQEAYEDAFGKEEGKEAASKTASKKKGAKTLGAGVKISSANSADDLSNLWECPPDVSHIFKN
jgi:hypothetical protein